MIASFSPSDREQLLGIGTLLTSQLCVDRSIPQLSATVVDAAKPFLEALPVQAAAISPRHRIRRWIDIAAVFEAHGMWDVAWTLLTNLRDKSGGEDQTSRRHYAFLTARLGRVARVRGDLDDAEHWYREAFALSAQLPIAHRWLDARPHALLGLCVMNVGRGNYPLAETFATRVLRSSAPELYLVQAYLVSALIARKRGNASRSLSYLWKAYDLLPSRDPRHTDLLITLAETAAELGLTHAAVRARLAALARARTPRLAASALAGLLLIAAQTSPGADSWLVTTIARSSWGRRLSVRMRQNPSRSLLLEATQGWLLEAEQLGFSPIDMIFLYDGAIRLALSLSTDALPVGDKWISDGLSTLERLVTEQSAHEWSFKFDELRAQARVRCSAIPGTLPGVQPVAPVNGSTTFQGALAAPDFSEDSPALTRSKALQRLAKADFRVAFDARAALR